MISIVIPTYNSERFMPDLLNSIFKTGIGDMEVVIVDDCSTDNTVKIAKGYPVKIIELENNSGPAKARNLGVRAARGDIIFFLDADVVVMNGTIGEVRDYFDKNPSANCVIGICEKEPLNNGFVPRYMALFEYIHLKGSKADKVSVFSPRCGALRKDLFEKVGGYKETYRRADIEDFEFARRINRTGSIILNRNMIVRHQFANLKQAVRNYFTRAVLWVHLFIKERKLDNAGPSVPSNGIAAISAFLSFISLFFLPFLNIAPYFFIFFLIVFVLANLRWLNFMRGERGVFFAVRALFLNYFLGIEITIAVIFGLLSYPFAEKIQGI